MGENGVDGNKVPRAPSAGDGRGSPLPPPPQAQIPPPPQTQIPLPTPSPQPQFPIFSFLAIRQNPIQRAEDLPSYEEVMEE